MINLYLHGLPGGPGELDALPGISGLIAPDRLALVESGDPFPRYLETLSRHLLTLAADQPVRLIGFSLGAWITLLLAPRLALQVRDLHLISPAAPLHLAPPGAPMAGRSLFRLAAMPPGVLRQATRVNAWLAARWPEKFYRMVFGKALGKDRDLVNSQAFQTAMVPLLHRCITDLQAGYLLELRHFVQPWTVDWGALHPPVTLWHGMEDQWMPAAMSQGLARMLPKGAQVHLLPGYAHYSTLQLALSRLPI